MSHNRIKIDSIQNIVSREVGRGISRLAAQTAGNLYKAASSIATHPDPSVAICTGFYIPKAKAAETDGPVGSALLACGLAKAGIPVSILTDYECRGAVAASLAAVDDALNVPLLCYPDFSINPTHFISIERAGPSASGRIYNMAGLDITDWTPNFHDAFVSKEWTKIAIGDGGNEIGMGSIDRTIIEQDVKHGEKIACITPCDYLIVAGVSNWGAWGLIAALSLLRPDWHLDGFLDADLSEKVLRRCVDEGPAVDGVTGKREYTTSRLNPVYTGCPRSGVSRLFGERRSSNRSGWATPHPIGHKEIDSKPKRGSVDKQKEAKSSVWEAARELQEVFFEIDRLVDLNGRRVRKAFRENGVGPHHFAGSTGYGHGDLGRGALDKVVAQAFGGERALVRHNFVSGTHAIAAGLFGVLRPGHELICVTGRPYDTLEAVIGLTDRYHGTLMDWGVRYTQIDFLSDDRIDIEKIERYLNPTRKQVVYIQRSCGYSFRPTVSIPEIAEVVAAVKWRSPDCVVMIDNCYGEFTEAREPCHVGADLVMGSLIKNPGGTIVSTGGYVCGRADLVEAANSRLTAPGIGIDSGSISGEMLRLMFQGFYLSPQTVGEALKSSKLISKVMSEHGFHTAPSFRSEKPPTFITAIELGSEARMVEFCSIVQRLSPVGSYVQPVPGAASMRHPAFHGDVLGVTPGYEDHVVFADGTFVDGSTSELSADGPIREPFAVYCQGGTHWTQWAEILESILTTDSIVNRE